MLIFDNIIGTRDEPARLQTVERIISQTDEKYEHESSAQPVYWL